ncbi:MAG: hypothetical protein ACRDTV_04340 [Mycobacterium sp.]
MEISDEQRRTLSAIAQQRRMRGYSALVREALDRYLTNFSVEDVEILLGLEGVLMESDAQEVRSRINDVWTAVQSNSVGSVESRSWAARAAAAGG